MKAEVKQVFPRGKSLEINSNLICKFVLSEAVVQCTETSENILGLLCDLEKAKSCHDVSH